MHYLQTKVNKIFKIIIHWELSRSILKYVLNNLMLPFWIRQYALNSLSYLDMKGSFVFLQHRCFFTNKSRSIINFVKMNRMRFKTLIAKAYLPGITKSS